MKILAWLLSLVFAFSLGAKSQAPVRETDSELRQKVQQHLDTIVDESAALVDDVAESVRNDPLVQEVKETVESVQEAARETLEDVKQVVENAKERMEDAVATPVPTDAAESRDGADEVTTPVPMDAVESREGADGLPLVALPPAGETGETPDPFAIVPTQEPFAPAVTEMPAPGEPING